MNWKIPLPLNITRRGRECSALAVMLITLLMPAAASATSQSYSVLNNDAKAGMLMSLGDNQGVVEPATTKNAASLTGVYTNEDTALDIEPGQISVETNGNANTLVSTINGDINAGDRISTSSIGGVGAKAPKNSWVVGTAQGGLSKKTKGAIATTVTDSKNEKHTVYIATIPVTVHVIYFAASDAPKKTTVIPEKVQATADAIAGKHVSVLGLVLSFILLVIGTVIAGVVIYSAVKNAYAAVARQPLSRASIFRLTQKSFAMAVGIIILVMVGALLLLRIL